MTTSLQTTFHEIRRSQHSFLHTCSGLWFFASEASDLVHRDAFVLVPCIPDASKFVVDSVEILTEEFMAYSLMPALLTLAA